MRAQTIVDIGTGSGCIAITLALELPNAKIFATDISASALKTAKKNADLHGVANRITFLKGNLLEPLKNFTEPFIIVSNPPYIPEHTKLEKDVADFEPHHALFAGTDGLAIIKLLLKEIRVHPYCTGMILECRSDQVGELKANS